MSSPPKDTPNKRADPGWNDPPMLNYSPANPPPKSRITNKRVAFPISGAGVTKPTAIPTSPVPAQDSASDDKSVSKSMNVE